MDCKPKLAELATVAVGVTVERSAFARAWEFTQFNSLDKRLAQVAAVATACFYILLLGCLAAFVDLIVAQGQIPPYSQLNGNQQRLADAQWQAMTDEQHQQALAHLGILEHQRQRLANTPGEQLTLLERQIRWRAQVWLILNEKIGSEAANQYQPAMNLGDIGEFRGFEVDPEHGALSLVLRTHFNWYGPAVAWVISWNRWTWAPVLGSTPNLSYLNGLLLIALGLSVLRMLLDMLMRYAAGRAAIGVATRLRRAVFTQTYRLGTLTVRAAGSSEASGLFTSKVESVREAVAAVLTSQLREPIKFVLLLLLALAIHFWLTVVFLIAALLVYLIGLELLEAVNRRGERAARRAATQLALLQESLMIMRLVKAFLIESFNQNRVERQLTDYTNANISRSTSEALTRPLIFLLGLAVCVTVLYVGGRIVLHEAVGPVSLIVLAVTLASLCLPVLKMLEVRKVIRRGMAAAEDIYEFLDRRGEVSQAASAEFLPGLNRALIFDDVSLREAGTGRMLLKNITLKIEAGQRVGLIATDEAERNAFLFLLPRFLDPTGGEIRIDGKNLRWVTLDSLRMQIGLVLQNNLIFNDTIANNIGCGDTGYTLPQIIEVAKTVHAHHFIQRLPYGYETPIGELGHSLSPSEKFRIALARAILRDPALLIIEEPETPLDEDSKAMIDDAYNRCLVGRTVIFVPRRRATLRLCDQVLLLNHGKIEAVGDHKALLEQNDLYKYVYYMEFSPLAAQVS